mmetsp:Transcript_17219/g.25516  ORF Transcript_17219/g.25516 Transcript_17219/m.25516 type:complete len:109 (-) Transcript_17219:53-379(-)
MEFLNRFLDHNQPPNVHVKPHQHTWDQSDPIAVENAIEQMAREKMVARARVKIAERALSDCYNKEGVNHYQNCKKYADKYLDLVWYRDDYGALLTPEPDRAHNSETQD